MNVYVDSFLHTFMSNSLSFPPLDYQHHSE